MSISFSKIRFVMSQIYGQSYWLYNLSETQHFGFESTCKEITDILINSFDDWDFQDNKFAHTCVINYLQIYKLFLSHLLSKSLTPLVSPFDYLNTVNRFIVNLATSERRVILLEYLERFETA